MRLGGTVSDWHGGALIVAAVLIAQAGFDVAGGWWLMPRPRPSAAAFLRRWFAGTLGHTLVLAGVVLLSYASFVRTSGFALAVLVASIALALGRSHLLRLISGASVSKQTRGGQPEISAVVNDPAFTGGIVGLGRHAVSLVPANWRETLPATELAVESRRREWQISQGLPARAFLAVVSWNLLGTTTGTITLDLAKRAPAEALFGHACWMTLWAFASLLVLPVLSRHAVFAADRAAADSGLDPRVWITRFPGLIAEDGSESAAVQNIFYPIPSAAMRLQALDRPPVRWMLGSLARNNLYYSWATFTLLGRAVHCNAGRPALWIFPPTA